MNWGKIQSVFGQKEIEEKESEGLRGISDLLFGKQIERKKIQRDWMKVFLLRFQSF